MSDHDANLLFLLADMARQPALRQRFEHDPLAVLRDYQLTSEEREVLRDRDEHTLGGALETQVQRLLHSIRSLQSTTVLIPWPDKQVTVNSSSPATGPLATAIQFSVTGMFFYGTCSLSFQRPGSTVMATDISVQIDQNTGASTLTGTAAFEVTGPYDVVVTLEDTTPQESGRLPRGFTALASG